jgi:hypothetical protein
MQRTIRLNVFWDGSPRPEKWVKYNNSMIDLSVIHITLELAAQRSVFMRDSSSPAAFWRPLRVEGLIMPVTTSGRATAPSSVTGFKTSGLQMDKGHLMALELGGPDVGCNIIPQGRRLNEHGPWRQMETSLKLTAANKMGVTKDLSPVDWATLDLKGGYWMDIAATYQHHPQDPWLLTVTQTEVNIGSGTMFPVGDATIWEFKNDYLPQDVVSPIKGDQDAKLSNAKDEEAYTQFLMKTLNSAPESSKFKLSPQLMEQLNMSDQGMGGIKNKQLKLKPTPGSSKFTLSDRHMEEEERKMPDQGMRVSKGYKWDIDEEET